MAEDLEDREVEGLVDLDGLLGVEEDQVDLDGILVEEEVQVGRVGRDGHL